MAQNKLKKADVNASTWTGDTFVFATSPALTTPSLGVATATSINGATITSGTLNGSATGTNTGDQTSVSGNAWTATALATPRAIYGNNFDGSAALTQVIASTYGGTGNGFTKIAWPTTTEKTITIPDANMTITAAAATVLDDTTVAAMVDTLWGATATGTGGIARATSPTFVTPLLWTPTSGVLTNCTGLPTAWLVDDAVTLAKIAAGTAWNLITYDASGNPAAVVTGTSGQVLTSNGAGVAPTMQTPSGWTPKMRISTTFENNASRYTLTATSSGSSSLTTWGMIIATSNPSGSLKATWSMTNKTWAVLPVCQLSLRTMATATGNSTGSGDFFFGLGDVITVANAGITFTDKHIGIKVVKRLSDTYTIVGTQADWTTEAVTSTIASMATGDTIDLIIDILAASVVCYASVNNWAYASQTLWATNRPSSAGSCDPVFATSNRATGSQNFNWTLAGASFEH